VALLALWVAVLFVVVLATGSLSAHRVRDWINGHGVLGPAIYIVVSSALTLALFPGPLLAGASGLLFGTALGTPVSIAAATLGAVGAFSVSRWVAGDAVDELGGPRLRAASEWVGQRGFRSVLYARIAPAVPYTLVNYAAGLTPVRLGAFTAATAVGVAPRAFAYTALGGSLGHLDSPEALIAVGVLVAMALAGLAMARSERNGRRRRRPPAAPTPS
jgi:uncharacterized membrane protein YdjX (TVP38/TMEM64 family)